MLDAILVMLAGGLGGVQLGYHTVLVLSGVGVKPHPSGPHDSRTPRG